MKTPLMGLHRFRSHLGREWASRGGVWVRKCAYLWIAFVVDTPIARLLIGTVVVADKLRLRLSTRRRHQKPRDER